MSQKATQLINELTEKLNALDTRQILDVHEYLVQARDHVIAQLASYSSSYQQSVWKSISAAIDTALRTFEEKYRTSLAEAQLQTWHLSTQLVDAPLSAVGLNLGSVISHELPVVMTDYSADLVKGLTADARKRLTTRIRLGMLASQPMPKLIQSIGTEVDAGVFGTVLARATTIAQTELTRISGMGVAARLLQAKQRLPDLQQQWDARRDSRTRIAHRVANGQVVQVGSPFHVGGEELAYPGDPNGTAGNTINCRCRALPYSKLWPDVITPAQQALARGDQYK